MAAQSPIKATYTGSDPTGLAEFISTDFISITDGGTGAVTASDARNNLGLQIGVDIQAYAATLDDISALSPSDGSFIVGNGTNFTIESGATARASLDVYSTSEALAVANNLSDLNDAATARTNLGVGSGSNVTFTDLTLTGNLTVQGTTTSLNTETIVLDDNIILLNSNATGSATENAGIEVERGNDTNVSFYWDETNDHWTVATEDFAASTFIGNLTGNVSNGTVSGLTSAIAIADGGTGATTAAGARTNLDVDSSQEVTDKAVNNGITFSIALG
jgi:hypothetical protein